MIVDLTHHVFGVKPGSRNFVFAESLSEAKSFPSCVAEIVDAKGNVTHYEVGKPKNPKSMYPLTRGVVTDEMEAKLFAEILKFSRIPLESDIVVATPEAELEYGRALLDREIRAVLRPKNLAYFSEPFCAAVTELGVDNALNQVFSTINLGSTSTGFGVFIPAMPLEGGLVREEKEILTSFTETSGVHVDDALFKKLKNVYGNPVVDINTVQLLKEGFNYKLPSYTPIEIVMGSAQKTIDCRAEVSTVLSDYIKKVATLFISILKSDSTITYSMLKNPVIITGGMSNIPGLAEAIKKEVDTRFNASIPIQIVKNGDVAPAKGALMLAKERF